MSAPQPFHAELDAGSVKAAFAEHWFDTV